MVLGAKLRTIMSSIIRWRKGETLRAAKMEQSTAGVVLMRSNNNEKPPSGREDRAPSYLNRRLTRENGPHNRLPRSGLVQLHISGSVYEGGSHGSGHTPPWAASRLRSVTPSQSTAV